MTLILNGTTGISGVDGSSGTPAFKGNDSNTGISFGTDIVTINTGGTARVTTDASGNVGIGTTSPSSFSAKLVVNNGTNKNTTVRGGIRLGGSAIQSIQDNAATDSPLEIYTGSAQLQLEGNPITFYNGGERMRIDSSGNVGIGTASPLARLNAQADNNNSDLGQLIVSGATSSSKRLSLGFNTTSNYGFVQSIIAGDNYYPLVLQPTAGNVGIGTVSPASTAKLTVQGGGANGTGGTRLLSDTLYANGANYEAYGRRQDANGSGGFAPGVLLARVNTAPAAIASDMNLGRVAFGGSYDGTDANVVYGAQIAGYSSGTYSASSAATDIVFFTTPSGTAGGTTSGTANFGTERMRIDSSGSLLVGAISNPNNDKFLLNQPTLNTWSRRTNCNNYGDVIVLSAASGIAHYFVTSNGTYAGDISVSGSTTSYNSGSDYRLKENVAPMQGALAKVAALKPCTYTWKADGSAGQGFIAHELQAIVPDCVTGTKDAVDAEGKPRYQGVDTSFLVATVVAALQELKAEVDSLKAQLQGAA